MSPSGAGSGNCAPREEFRAGRAASALAALYAQCIGERKVCVYCCTTCLCAACGLHVRALSMHSIFVCCACIVRSCNAYLCAAHVKHTIHTVRVQYVRSAHICNTQCRSVQYIRCPQTCSSCTGRKYAIHTERANMQFMH